MNFPTARRLLMVLLIGPDDGAGKRDDRAYAARLYQQTTATTLDNPGEMVCAKALGNHSRRAASARCAGLPRTNPSGANWAQEGRRFTVNDGEINATASPMAGLL